MLDLFSRYSIRKLSALSFSGKGFLNFRRLKKQIGRHLAASTFEELDKPLYVCISNLTKGVVDYVSSGPLTPALIASASIPVLFEPVRIGEDYYTDGAVFDNFPVKPLKGDCERIIGINIMPHSPTANLKGILSTGMRAFQLTMNEADRAKWEECDLLVSPQGLAEHGYLRHKKGMEMYTLGYEAAKKVL
jgi:NTE family protein